MGSKIQRDSVVTSYESDIWPVQTAVVRGLMQRIMAEATLDAMH